MNKPKIYTFDIETTPLKAYSWGPKWEANLIEVIEESKILSYSAKLLGGKKITRGWPNYKGYKKTVNDDGAIVNDIWNLFNDADILVVQNGKAFDVKHMNSRFRFHGLPPPSPYKVVDTKTEAKKYLRLPSYSLDDMCDYFGIGRKQEHEGFPLWKKCMAGNAAAWRRMLKYNQHDVDLTEQLYLCLLPWMQSHPNLGTILQKEVCPKCGSDKLQARGFARTLAAKYRRAQCANCSGWCRFSMKEDGFKVLRSI